MNFKSHLHGRSRIGWVGLIGIFCLIVLFDRRRLVLTLLRRLAAVNGPARMQAFLRNIDYGNDDVGGEGSSRICGSVRWKNRSDFRPD